jgi:hypothetical protein
LLRVGDIHNHPTFEHLSQPFFNLPCSRFHLVTLKLHNVILSGIPNLNPQ